MVRNVNDRRPRINHAKPRIESSEFAQKRLEGRLSQPSFLWARRILERFQAIQNEQGPMMGDELRQSFALLPGGSEPRIWVAKPGQSGIKKFICRRSTPTSTMPVEGPTKNELCRTIVVSSQPSEPMVNERGLPDTRPGND